MYFKMFYKFYKNVKVALFHTKSSTILQQVINPYAGVLSKFISHHLNFTRRRLR